ncbi:hypothetical protein KIW84_051934 [Lathyrus oleraceus]|uniref:Uncharacterized protein n=1 Tax=Pisum sativum TaxID=3888 RepID=A0A9D5ABB2_PEA|nr:hypothetical protein KIW84_051934 [Pisum sativum]
MITLRPGSVRIISDALRAASVASATTTNVSNSSCLRENQGGLIELEKLLKQKTFTRSEIDHLTALMQSRTVEAPIRGGRRLKVSSNISS